jgi:hypothetical protein
MISHKEKKKENKRKGKMTQHMHNIPDGLFLVDPLWAIPEISGAQR